MFQRLNTPPSFYHFLLWCAITVPKLKNGEAPILEESDTNVSIQEHHCFPANLEHHCSPACGSLDRCRGPAFFHAFSCWPPPSTRLDSPWPHPYINRPHNKRSGEAEAVHLLFGISELDPRLFPNFRCLRKQCRFKFLRNVTAFRSDKHDILDFVSIHLMMNFFLKVI